MRLLIITQIIDRDDPVLGFFHRWVKEFAKHCTQVTVICLKEGAHDLPKNVRVYSLGKERGKGRFTYLLRFYALIWRLRREYDHVFVHMNQIYVILGGLLWRMWGKRVGLWYAHGTVSLSLRLAVSCANDVFTSTPEGFRIATAKRHIVGQGIPTDRFCLTGAGEALGACTVGRISKSKDLEMLLDVVRIVHERGVMLRLDVYGTALTEEDVRYERVLHTRILADPVLREYMHLAGPVSQEDLPGTLAQYRFFLSAGKTGSLDKAILEASATGRIVVSSNEGARAFLEDVHPNLAVLHNAHTMADAVETWSSAEEGEASIVAQKLAEKVRTGHSLERLIQEIIGVWKKKRMRNGTQ
jgi:glycosyltransferase involved in cell wall biosynthesis